MTARRYGEKIDPPAGLPHPDAFAALNARSVCRRYRSEPLPEGMLRFL